MEVNTDQIFLIDVKFSSYIMFILQVDLKSDGGSQASPSIGTIKMKSETSQDSTHSFGASVSRLSEDSNSGDMTPPQAMQYTGTGECRLKP